MSITFDAKKAHPIETDFDDVYTIEAFKVMVDLGHYNIDNCWAYFSNGKEYMLECPYFNIALPPSWATHVVMWPK